MLTPPASPSRSSCDSVRSRPPAIRAATASVGLVSPRSTWLSIGALTPLRSDRSRSERPIASRSALTRVPYTVRTLSRTHVCWLSADLVGPRGPADLALLGLDHDEDPVGAGLELAQVDLQHGAVAGLDAPAVERDLAADHAIGLRDAGEADPHDAAVPLAGAVRRQRGGLVAGALLGDLRELAGAGG